MDLRRYAFETLHQDGELLLCRGRAVAGTHPEPLSILVLMPTSDHPRPECVRMLEHELAFRSELDSAWAVRPLVLSRYQDRAALVLEDQHGEPLDRLLKTQPNTYGCSVEGLVETALDLGFFLRLAVRLAAAVGEVHRRRIIHKDLKPAHVIVNVATSQVWLTGFGLASRLPRERLQPEPPEAIAGTLAYMAPEQTGRMNRSIDARSDLYALGITLFEMLTGSTPFAAADPMEWVHCHIARHAPPPSERAKDVPLPLSAIIMKLLAKTPEDRYQTAAGLEHDLRRCLTQLEAKARIDNFELRERDTPDHLLIPEKLYGRDSEIATLLSAFHGIVHGGEPALVLVSGYAGIGKSVVVNELHKALVPSRGLFAAGKFDQYKRDIPYSTLAQAFQMLIRPLFAKSDPELCSWREAFCEALGANGQLMVDLVPELQLIIGPQLPVLDLNAKDEQRRFQQVFQRFLGVFARPEHPLALFLDDLQWLDAATLHLLEYLLTQSEVRYLLVIGAYRDNEVSSVHPLMRTLDRIRSVGVPVRNIVLSPLSPEQVSYLVADSLCCERQRSEPLAELVHQKTAGNPFFLIQFLSALVDEGLVIFDYRAMRWFWDLDRIHAKGYTDNVVDLMVGKLTRLPMSVQELLQQLACLGNTTDFELLAIVQEGSKDKLLHELEKALRTGLLLQSGDSYRFLHDRVQEAAYSLIPEHRRAAAHLRIGRLLALHTPAEQREEAIFELVNQLNRGVALITSQEEKVQLAEFNLAAGARGEASTAYGSALKYFVAGATLLSDDGWARQPQLMFALELRRARCEFLTGELAGTEARLTALLSRVANPVDRASVACVLMDVHISVDKSDCAVDVFLDYMRHLGTEWSRHPEEEEVRQEYEQVRSQLRGREIEELIDLPLMSDPDSVATLDVLMKALSPAAFMGPNLFNLIVLRMINLSLEHGNTDASCEAYTQLGKFGGPRFGSYEDTFRFCRLGHDLIERRGLKRFEARTRLVYAIETVQSTVHPRMARGLLRDAFDIANNVGELPYATYASYHLTSNLLAVGDPLIEVQSSAEQSLEFARKAHYGLMIDTVATQLVMVRMLRGLTTKFGCFNGGDFDEIEFERRISNPRLTFPAYWYWTRKVQARFLAGDYQEAVNASLNAQRLIWLATSYLDASESHFYGALSHAAAHDSAPSSERGNNIQALTAHYQQLTEFAQNCSEIFKARASLVAAEIARIQGRELDAERLYENAIGLARQNDFINHEALANELAAHFYATRGFEMISQAYMRNARYCYLRWGADGKVRQLDQLYPHLRKEEQPVSTGTMDAPVEQLDLATVIKVSQAVSSEMGLEKLLGAVMRIAIEYAGAERAVLVLSRGTDQRIAAQAKTANDTVTVQLLDEAVTASILPEAVFNYTVHTREAVILDDAAGGNPFSTDPYFSRQNVRSVLCLPLANQATLIGILYLENNLAPGAFAPTRLTVLKLLASQAAISLENTKLYRDLEKREAKIRHLVEANIIGIYFIDLGGQILEANDAFLQMTGYEREDLVSGSMRWTDLTPPELLEADAVRIETLRKMGSLPPFEKEYIRKDGTRVPVLVGVARFEEEGNQAVVFALDMSGQKRVEGALRRNEADLHEAQRLAHAGSWKLDLASGRTVVSPEIYRIFDARPGEDLSNPEFWFSRIHPEDRAQVREYFEKCVAEKLDYNADYRIVLPDASIRYQHSIGRPVLSRSGTLLEFIGTAVDTTEQVRARIKLEAAFEEIKQLKEHLFEENVALKQEIDEAARVNERTRIARELHDTLLQNFHGLMFQFQAARNLMTRRPEEAVRSLDDAIRETRRAIAESREAIQGLRSAPMGNLVDVLMSKSRELSDCNSNEHPPVFDLIEEGDRRTLSSAVNSEVCRIGLELLRNAYEHAHAQRIEAEIRYGDSMFRLRIRDDGRGIDSKMLKEGGRVGHWGLQGVRERADRIGAQLDLWSEPGSGTEVQLLVPAFNAYESLRKGIERNSSQR